MTAATPSLEEPRMSATPPPLTDQQLAAIRDSVPIGYDGPWTFDLEDDGRNWVVLYATDHPQAGLVCTVPDYGQYLAEFIATARTAVPQLLAELDRLRAERDQARAGAFAEAIDRFRSLADLAPDFERAPGLNFAVGALMAMRDRAARTAPDAPHPAT